MTDLPLISLSQGQLKFFETCPRQYQYFETLPVLREPDLNESAEWGKRFHRLMQQQALGLPIEVMAPADQEMMASVEALRGEAPHLFESDLVGKAEAGQQRLSEFQQTLEFKGYLLTVIYDLLLLTADTGQIIDWKTYLKPPQKNWLWQDWQTRLYLYVLSETSGLSPNQISMVYWFVRSKDPQTQKLKLESYELTYSDSLHHQTETDLLALTDRLTELRRNTMIFPKVALSKGVCERCPFAFRCQRLPLNDGEHSEDSMRTLNDQLINGLMLDAIEEIPL